MTDVHDLLARTHDALGASGTTLDATRHDALLAGIRRRRRRRHAAESLGVVALVVVLGAGGWFATQRDGTPQPAQSATPTPAVTPTPTSAPTPAPTDAAPTLVPAPGAPGLLPASVLPPGVLEAAAPGWVLTTQQPVHSFGDLDEWAPATAQVVDLVSPTGTRYRVLDLPPEPRVDVGRWVAGATDALVTVSGSTGTPGGARLDLRTGVLTPLPGLGDAQSYVGRGVGGVDLWWASSGAVLVHDGTRVVRELPPLNALLPDATGTRVAGDGTDGEGVLVVDVASGAVVTGPTPDADLCSAVGWHGAELLLGCYVDDGMDWPEFVGLWRWDVTRPTVAPTRVSLPGADVPMGAGVELADGRLAVPVSQAAECHQGWSVLDVEAGTLAPANDPGDEPNWYRLGAAGGAVYVETSTGCSGDLYPVRLSLVDPTTGASVELAGLPPDTDLPAGGNRWVSTTTSWAVAAAP